MPIVSIKICIFKHRKPYRMNADRKNRWFSGALFTGLGLFAWLLLAGYTDMSSATENVLKDRWGALFLVILFNVLGFLTLRISAWLNVQYLLHARRKWKIVIAHLCVLGMFFIVNYGFLVVGKLLAGSLHPFSLPNSGMRMLIVVWLVELSVLGLLLANRAMAQTLSLKQRTVELQRENDTARYMALQQQLNPHFLFNSLNTLVAEIEYNPAQAISFTRRLSEVYRYVLQAQNRLLVTLDEELRFAEAYLYLHRVRLGNCLDCRVEIPQEIKECRLPPLTLQLLIENVIKHNTITTSHPLTILISANESWLSVSNPIRPKRNAVSGGLGLQNLSNRCRMMLDREIEVVHTDALFTVKIPLSHE